MICGESELGMTYRRRKRGFWIKSLAAVRESVVFHRVRQLNLNGRKGDTHLNLFTEFEIGSGWKMRAKERGWSVQRAC